MEELIKKYIDAYNNFDIEKMTQCLHEDVIFENYSNGELTAKTNGISEFRKLAETSKDIFSSRKQVPANFSNEDGDIAVDIEFEGIIASDLPNGAKKGDLIKISGKSEFKFKDEKISKITDLS